MIRNQQKLVSASLVPGVRLDLNPFQQRMGTARVLRNWLPEQNRMTRKPYSPAFQVAGSSNSVWNIIDYRYHRANAPESKLLIFRDDGKIYQRTAGAEVELFPGNTGFPVLNSQPSPIVLNNKLFFSDATSAYVYDGRTFRAWGIPIPTVALVVSVQAGAGITAASGLSGSYTWVVLDENGNRVHESTHSPASAFSAALSNQTFRGDITGLTPPAGVTHWSFYVSELDGSNIRRRASTKPIATLTSSITALPAGTNPIEPVRNDPPAASLVMAQWKNRIAMRQENNPQNVWFTAFGEVSSTSAGAPEECLCGKDANSLSDLVNEFPFPAFRTRLIIQHDNALNIFTESDGYIVLGSGGVLDSIGSRELMSTQQFSEGACGAFAGASTPYGLAWMTPGRRIELWDGAAATIDIGLSIQPQLNTIPEGSLPKVQFYWWDGNGRKWLMVALNCADSDNLTGAPSQRILIYDFALSSAAYGSASAYRASEAQHPGEWFEWTDNPYTAVGSYMDGDERFLLGGDSSGNVWLLDKITQPAHVNRSMILGGTYLGSAIQDNPANIMRTGLLSPANDTWVTGLYISLIIGIQTGPNLDFGVDPIINSAVDPINPDVVPNIALTPGVPSISGETRWWLLNQLNGTAGGALAKQFQFDASYASGASNNREVDGRFTMTLECIYKLGFSWQAQQGELKA